MIVAARFTNKSKQNATDDKGKLKRNRKKNLALQKTFTPVQLMNDKFMSHSSWSKGNSSQLSVSVFQTNPYGSVPNLRYIGTNKWGLIYQQTLALKVTWSKLCKTPHSTCCGISGIIGGKNKILRDIFYNAAFVNGISERRTIATLHDHSHFIVSLISQIIQSFETDSDDIFKHINKIGLCHFNLTKYGFQRKLWDNLGEELIDALVVQNCIRSFPGSCRAWTILLANLIDHLCAATISPYSTSIVTKSHNRSKLTSVAIYKSISN
ncbi:hypothetical protein LOAG_07373 [Loa loa]|uniref:GLOBIN domain-containing protein n=1 Tax=Loa loa TaxID=7209 RepID=A0A1I7VRG0_LOALO|nr:hypothetical protein LOAG_07373 [Loa loa]EFO21115.2 hypothetical protein LOAG_07373 [Loa loa]